MYNVDERLKQAGELFVKQASIAEVSKKISNAVDESLSKQQKEFYLRQQLAAIQRELNNLHREGSGNAEGLGNSSELDDDEAANADDMAETVLMNCTCPSQSRLT